MKILNNLFLTQEGCHLCGEEWIFQQDNAVIHNASITKSKTSWPPIMLSRSQSYRKFVGLIVTKVYEGGWGYSELKMQSQTHGKNAFGTTSETCW